MTRLNGSALRYLAAAVRHGIPVESILTTCELVELAVDPRFSRFDRAGVFEADEVMIAAGSRQFLKLLRTGGKGFGMSASIIDYEIDGLPKIQVGEDP